MSTGLILKHILEDGGAFSWIALIIFSNKTVRCDNILTPAPIMMQSNFSCESVSETTLSAVSPRSSLHAFSVIPARYEHVPIWRTRGKYRKQMKRGYSRLLYNQRNKDETIISVIKRLFGEHITSRLVRTQNRELSFRCIAYNTHRLTNHTIITWFLQSQHVIIIYIQSLSLMKL